MAIRGLELGIETDRMFAEAEQKRAEREVGKTEFQEVVDASGMKPMTAEEFAYAGASMAPVTGDIIAYKEAPEDFERAYELMRKGYKEKDLVNLGLGAAFTGLVALGLIPGIGFVSRIGKNAAKDKVKDLLKDGNLTEAADIMVKSSKTFGDKALANKQSEAQLRKLAQARMELKGLSYREKKKAIKRLNRPDNITVYHGSKGMQDKIGPLTGNVQRVKNQRTGEIDFIEAEDDYTSIVDNRPTRKDDILQGGFRPYSGDGVFREKTLGNPLNKKRQGSTLKIDNPAGKDALTGETYVEKKIRQNREYMERNPNAGPVGLYSGITGYAKDIKFDPNELKGIKGEMGEDAFRMSGDAGENTFNKLTALEKSIKEEGYKPTNIKITVTEDGTPYITEGNHRLAEAIKSGRPEIVADVNYLRGGENAEGILNPNQIGIGKDNPTNFPSREPFTYARGLMSNETSGFHGEIEGVKLLSTSRDPNVSMSPSFTNPDDLPNVPADIPVLENLVSAEIPYESMKNMRPETYSELVRGLSRDKDAQQYLLKKYFSDKTDKYGATMLPKSGHVEAELAVAFPEYFNPRPILDRDPSAQNYNVGETLLENPKTGEYDSAAMLTEIRDVGKMSTPDKVQAASLAYKKADTHFERMANIEDQIKAAETLKDKKPLNLAYDNVKDTLNSMADLAKFTSEYGARGSYDKFLQRMSSFAYDVNRLATAFPEGSEKRANLKFLSVLMDSSGFGGQAEKMNQIRKGFTAKKTVDKMIEGIRKNKLPGSLVGTDERPLINRLLRKDSLVTTKKGSTNKMIARTEAEKNNPYKKETVEQLKDFTSRLTAREAKEMLLELTSRFNRGGLVKQKGLMARS